MQRVVMKSATSYIPELMLACWTFFRESEIRVQEYIGSNAQTLLEYYLKIRYRLE